MTKFLAKLTMLLVILCSCRNDQYITDLCFEQKVLPILVNKCANMGCHNPIDLKEGYDFTYYEGVLKAVKPKHANSSKLWLQIKFGKMPPKSSVPLTDEEKLIIKSWIQLGAPNNSCSNVNVCDTNRTLVYNDIKRILDLHCTGCHNSNNPSAGWNLDNYTDVKAAANSGYLIGTIEWLPGYKKMPLNAPKVPNCEILSIKKWINDGMPQ